MRILLVLGLFVFAATSVGAQTPTRDQVRIVFVGSAVVSGTVVSDDETRAPLRNAFVTLSRSGVEDIRTTPTDAQGKFVFERLPAGSYTLGAGKGGYIYMSYGAPRPGMPGRVVTVVDGQAASAAPIALRRGAVIAGRILDRNGHPVLATVEAVQFAVVRGERRRRTTSGASATAETNAHGEYRMHGLLPGDYLVTVTAASTAWSQVTPAELSWSSRGGVMPPPSRSFSYAATFFPGSVDVSSAQPIRLGAGEERLGVDFSPEAVMVADVRGTVSLPDGGPAQGFTVIAVPKRAGMTLGIPVRIFSDQSSTDGAFSISALQPGEYVVSARGGLGSAASPAPRLWGFADVRLAGADQSGVGIRLRLPVAVSGRVIARAGSGSTLNPTRVRVQLVAADSDVLTLTSGNPSAVALADGSFAFSGLMPGRYHVSVTVVPGEAGSTWVPRSIVRDGVDYSDVPIEVGMTDIRDLVVTVADDPSELTGTLTDQEGRSQPHLYVLAFSTDKKHWTTNARRTAAVLASESGSFRLAGLPAGEYYLCALTELDTMLQSEPEYLEQFVSASFKITIADGEKKTQNLRVGR